MVEENGIQFEQSVPQMSERSTLKYDKVLSAHLTVLFVEHVCVCNFTGVPCVGAVCEYDYCLKFESYHKNQWKIYGYSCMKLKTKFSDLMIW